MNTEKQFILAFNNGFILAKYEPDFSNILFKNLNPTNNYLHGILAGKKQDELEKTKYQLIEIDELRKRSLSRGNEQEFD